MKINASVTMLFNENGMVIEVRDDDAATRFLELKLSSEQVCQAFSRLCNTPVQNCLVFGLDKLGVVHENKYLEFFFNDGGFAYSEREEAAYKEALQVCPKGWVPDNYFGSHNSFFTRGTTRFARCIIRRWVKKGE